MPGGKHLYRATDLHKLLNNSSTADNTHQKKDIIDALESAAASLNEQTPNDRQSADLRAQYAAAELMCDLGCGIN
jgi:hypothetical protein